MMVITKADGENIHKAELAQTQFQGALRLFPVPESGWRPKVYTSSAVARTGLEEVWKGVEEYLDHIQKNGYFQHNRNRQNKYWMYETDQRGAARKFLPRPGRGGVHRSVRETRAGGQNLVVHRRQGVAGDLFQGRPDAGMTRVTVRRAGCRQVDMPIIQPL